jgi:TolB protein
MGLLIVFASWLMLSEGLSLRGERSAAALARPLPDLGPGLLPITKVTTYTEAVYLPLIDYGAVPPEKIAFETLRDGNYEVYLMNPDGSEQTNLTNSASTQDVAPAWSPDGRQLAFVSDRDGDDEIYVMSRDGTGIVQLTDNGYEDDWPAWSPDGTQIAFQSERNGNYDLYVMNADGSAERRITSHGAKDRWPDWSPDGAKIAFTSNRLIYKKIFAVNPDGSGLTVLSDPNAYYDDRYSTWAPEGRITFVSDRPAPSDGSRDDEIYIMRADGRQVQQLTDNDDGDWLARWAPDGLQFAFYSDRHGNRNIYVKDLVTGTETQITNSLSDEYPAWSP